MRRDPIFGSGTRRQDHSGDDGLVCIYVCTYVCMRTCVRMCVNVFFLVLKHGRTMMRPSRCDTIAVQCAVLPETCCIRRARCVRWASGAALIRAQHCNKMQRPLRSPKAPTWHKPFRRDNKVATTRSHDLLFVSSKLRRSQDPSPTVLHR